MEKPDELALRLRQVFLDGKWITNTNYKELLEDVDWDMANKKVADLNTLLALTFHINYYLAGVLNVLKGGELEIRDKFSYDFQHIDNAAKWESLKSEMNSNAAEFISKVEKMSESELDGPFIVEKYGTYRRNIEGIIEHSYYHLGQMVVKETSFLTLDAGS
ncbi:MAG: DUF1572 domain-containing protein [Saprospiraceae bacterium]